MRPASSRGFVWESMRYLRAAIPGYFVVFFSGWTIGKRHLRGPQYAWRSLMRMLWTFINTDLGRLLVGFVLTSVIGGALLAAYQQNNWEKQQELQFQLQQRQWMRDK